MELAVVAGFEEVVNDPLLWRHGLRVGVAAAPTQVVELAVAGIWYPVTSDGSCSDTFEFKRGTCESIYEVTTYSPPPRMEWQGQAVARILPVVGHVPGWTIWAGGHAGFALVLQHDDWLTHEHDGSLAHSWTVGPVAGLTVEAQRGTLGLRLRFEQVHYIEPFPYAEVGEKLQQTLGAEVMFWLL